MPQTFAEKIMAKKAGLDTTDPGQIVEITPDVVLSHDNTAPIKGIFEHMGGDKVFNPEMHAIILDHATPAPTTKHAENHRIIREFVADQGIKNFYDVGRGICHQVVVEEVHYDTMNLLLSWKFLIFLPLDYIRVIQNYSFVSALFVSPIKIELTLVRQLLKEKKFLHPCLSTRRIIGVE